MNSKSKLERDSMGVVSIPADALYGPQTQRAFENFPISGVRMPRGFLHALGLIKCAAALANHRLGLLSPQNVKAIEQAAMAVALGRHDDQFVVDVFQTGSGTSTNMNANEVIAHLASAQTGEAVHPNDHVNLSQSSNDVIPAAIHISAALQVHESLLPNLAFLKQGLLDKAASFADVIKIGRTHLQDAVPMRLGDEFGGYARQVELSMRRLEAAVEGLYELPLGGTAVGTGLNAPGDFARLAVAQLKDYTGLPFREASNHFEAQSAKDAVGFLSGALRTCAIALGKIANDIRWLGSGPRCGLAELHIPEVQPGSSMMPGKVNPVIAESVLMVCAQVVGYDAAIAWCTASGNFELNTMMPLIAYDVLESIQLLSAAAKNFEERCIRGLDVNRERTAQYARQSLANVTALVPEIGYDRAAAIALAAYRDGRSLEDVARERSGLPESQLRALLDPALQLGNHRTLTPSEKVDLMSEQSFPASDAPAR